jgi:hypothetical protein
MGSGVGARVGAGVSAIVLAEMATEKEMTNGTSNSKDQQG